MKVEGKTIVVTGGGSGMGHELTLLLLNKGARVAGVRYYHLEDTSNAKRYSPAFAARRGSSQ